MRAPHVPHPVSAVLFDLDGTLLDTAPDMVSALNGVLAELELPSIAFETARAYVSNGAVGLLRLAIPAFEPARDTTIHRRFLDLYAATLVNRTTVFAGLDPVLDALDRRQIPWGVVTNKPRHLTEPLLSALGVGQRCACIVSGDTLPERKPHPRPITHALDLMRRSVDGAIVVGDARRDIEAGRAAGARTIAVRYGYVPPGQDPFTWGADFVIDVPGELGPILMGSP